MNDEKPHENAGLYNSLRYIVAFEVLLWLVKSVEIATNNSYHTLGVYPRTIQGMIGIFTGPLIHGDIFHLLSNSIPILILGSLLFLMYRRVAFDAFIAIYLLSGALVWIFGRQAYHIGASGIVYGLFSFIFLLGFILRQNRTMLVSLVVFFLYGGIIYGITPQRSEISWESHLMGLIAGLVLAFIFRYRFVFKRSISSFGTLNQTFTDQNQNNVYQYIYLEKSIDKIEIKQEETSVESENEN